MSQFAERVARMRELRPWPVSALARRLGIPDSDPQATSKLALQLGIDRRWIRRYRQWGLTTRQADEWAHRAGVGPEEVWDHWYSDLQGVVLLNANRITCPQGHPYDGVDGRGRRICHRCEAARVARHRAKTQVIAVVTTTGAFRAPPMLFDVNVPQEDTSRERVITRVPADVAHAIDQRAQAAGLSRSAMTCMILTSAVREQDTDSQQAS